MLDRVDPVQARPEDREGAAAALQGAAVGSGVDAARQAADHREAGTGGPLRHPVRDAHPVRRRTPRSDDGDRQHILRTQIAPDVEQGRWIRGEPEQLRVAVVLDGQDAGAETPRALQLVAGRLLPSGAEKAGDGLQGRDTGARAVVPGEESPPRSGLAGESKVPGGPAQGRSQHPNLAADAECPRPYSMQAALVKEGACAI